MKHIKKIIFTFACLLSLHFINAQTTSSPASNDGLIHYGETNNCSQVNCSQCLSIIHNSAYQGYRFYQPISDMSSASMQTNPYFRDNQTTGDMPLSSGSFFGPSPESQISTNPLYHSNDHFCQNPLFQD